MVFRTQPLLQDAFWPERRRTQPHLSLPALCEPFVHPVDAELPLELRDVDVTCDQYFAVTRLDLVLAHWPRVSSRVFRKVRLVQLVRGAPSGALFAGFSQYGYGNR